MGRRKKAGSKAAASKRSPKPGNKRYRRTEDELIADLEARLTDLRDRARLKDLKSDPALRKAMNADKALIRAAEACSEAGYKKLGNALKAAHFSIEPHLKPSSLLDE